MFADCYDLVVAVGVHYGAGTPASDTLYTTPMTVRVQNPKTVDARIVERVLHPLMRQSSPDFANPSGTWREPAYTSDGLLYLSRFVHDGSNKYVLPARCRGEHPTLHPESTRRERRGPDILPVCGGRRSPGATPSGWFGAFDPSDPARSLPHARGLGSTSALSSCLTSTLVLAKEVAMKTIPTKVVRVLLGALLLFSGLNKFFGFVPSPTHEGDAAAFMAALAGAGYVMPLVGVIEIVCGAAFVVGRFVALALIVFAPVAVNIVLFHAALDPAGGAPGFFVGAATIYLIIVNFPKYKMLLAADG